MLGVESSESGFHLLVALITSTFSLLITLSRSWIPTIQQWEQKQCWVVIQQVLEAYRFEKSLQTTFYFRSWDFAFPLRPHVLFGFCLDSVGLEHRVTQSFRLRWLLRGTDLDYQYFVYRHLWGRKGRKNLQAKMCEKELYKVYWSKHFNGGSKTLTIHSHFKVGNSLFVYVESLLQTVQEFLVVGCRGGILGKSRIIFFGALHK